MIIAVVTLGVLCGFLFVWNLGLSGAVSDLSQRLRKQEAMMKIVSVQSARTAVVVSMNHQEHSAFLSTPEIISEIDPEFANSPFNLITTPHGQN